MFWTVNERGFRVQEVDVEIDDAASCRRLAWEIFESRWVGQVWNAGLLILELADFDDGIQRGVPEVHIFLLDTESIQLFKMVGLDTESDGVVVWSCCACSQGFRVQETNVGLEVACRGLEYHFGLVVF